MVLTPGFRLDLSAPFYPAASDSTPRSCRGGLTRITETYLDGQLKRVTGTAVTAEYHDYTVNDGTVADYEAGSITETVHYGTIDGEHWRRTTTNFLGQVLREDEQERVRGEWH